MKYFIIAVALLGATATTSLAQGLFPPPPTAAETQSGKQAIITQTNLLETALKNKNLNQAEAAAAAIAKGMVKRVAETRYTAEAQTGAARETIMQRMLMMEGRVSNFHKGQKDVMANGASLVAQARTFTGDY